VVDLVEQNEQPMATSGQASTKAMAKVLLDLREGFDGRYIIAPGDAR
jgi:hypothetical protein